MNVLAPSKVKPKTGSSKDPTIGVALVPVDGKFWIEKWRAAAVPEQLRADLSLPV
jgi:hypothetical protein